MSPLPDVIELSAEEEARRLWDGAVKARARADDDLVALCESVDLGLRAAELLVGSALEGVKSEFPATIALLLDRPEAEVDAHRDATNVPATLGFTEVLDLLSAGELECVAPGLHRGWEDRRFSCRRSRETAQQAMGVSLDGEARERLLVLTAYRNRLFRSPPPVRVLPGHILDAFGSLEDLMGKLLQP